MSLSLLPCATIWLALFAAAAFAWHRPLHGLSIILATFGYAVALAFGKLGALALAPLALLAAAAWGVLPARPRAVRIAAHAVFAALAIALSLHLIPGFHNPLVIGPTRFTPDAVPFTMYLNLDKPLVGLWLLWALPWVAPDVALPRALRTGAMAAVATAAACLAGALAFGMVGWAPKWPASGWLWLVNNLLLVTLAEEALFRGYVQGGLTRALRAFSWGPWAALATGAVLFGAAHAAGGWQWIVLGTLAGAGYGLAWRRGGLLAAAIAHAGLNVVHFGLFTYPMLAAAR
ncbi:CPBP family intramembrane glutamic endopeptidase [Burkholderia seminalis]|uniref:CPBP family intramembrane glutamic endopeptidase n=1 Tax=Burkholderia seminalis TaxID=488731 RepID=UPI00075F276C|nr:CPBP family intramembrane glutamic endopeptidase [Burkholderia seminalis]AOJ28771.1 CAAX protease [Burkholderia seminalis]KVF52800.1 CAAX protease [Burkholderia seminalis]MCA8042717.1 CPBP family intramembrane metalloprotease [Burkholderia seminalis]RQS79145.1 CPBP family intramembrane metalloprotease [Burkholderia seminalis]RQS93494.1 CPBP family intramembrane metalloprotease [Burkholderia seminalis]